MYRRCGNFRSPAGCNWRLEADEHDQGGQPLCISCRLNRTIPDQSVVENQPLWGVH
ncbi:zinc-ribbon domain-containing protein [Caldimonas mangrovi]|uniref:zinc-ribbon domain-containing protein n=1 Tax=Caldimonas mangrovi TaxID=2944811 RepID=UPI0034A213AE